MTGQLKAAALAYAERLGWAVFPCNGKVPAIRGGRGCLDATTDHDVIAGWWSEYPTANVGVVTGELSGWVLDLDGDEGEESLLELVRDHGPLPETVEQLTGGGGRHLLFRHVNGIGNRTAIRPGIDVRGSGGYVIAPPSLHPETKRRYAWEVDHHPLDAPIAEAPDWLLALVGKRCAPVAPVGGARPWRLAPGEIAEGQRNDVLTRLAGHLLRRWVDAELAFTLICSLNATHCRPPLPLDEVARTFNSVLATELRRREAN